ncbi:MAG: hypothetical protein V1721_07930 [Pseudomonadota bacterium]
MKEFAKVFAAVLLFSIVNIADAGACYSSKEFEAEQGVRIHSELMVIGLTCMKMPEGRELYGKYQAFTAKNSSLIAGYETDIIAYYGKQGVAKPEKKFHTLRTNLANEISRRAIKMSTLNFCKQYSSHMDRALAMDQQKLRRWAQHAWPNRPTTEPVCVKVAQQG